MSDFGEQLKRWLPAVFLMSVVFYLSSQPGNELPNFGSLDFIVKKGGHMLGYGLLSLTYWHGMGRRPASAKWAWLLSLLYAATDEYHQTFVPGRHPSPVDVFVFDGVGAALALWAGLRFRMRDSV